MGRMHCHNVAEGLLSLPKNVVLKIPNMWAVSTDNRGRWKVSVVSMLSVCLSYSKKKKWVENIPSPPRKILLPAYFPVREILFMFS